MNGQVLVDTGPIVAILLESDETSPKGRPWKEDRSLRIAAGYARNSLAASVITLGETDLPGIALVLAKYEGLGIQLADASLVHLANREGIEIMFTLDRRDFGVLRLARGKKLRLIP